MEKIPHWVILPAHITYITYTNFNHTGQMTSLLEQCKFKVKAHKGNLCFSKLEKQTSFKYKIHADLEPVKLPMSFMF